MKSPLRRRQPPPSLWIVLIAAAPPGVFAFGSGSSDSAASLRESGWAARPAHCPCLETLGSHRLPRCAQRLRGVGPALHGNLPRVGGLELTTATVPPAPTAVTNDADGDTERKNRGQLTRAAARLACRARHAIARWFAPLALVAALALSVLLPAPHASWAEASAAARSAPTLVTASVVSTPTRRGTSPAAAITSVRDVRNPLRSGARIIDMAGVIDGASAARIKQSIDSVERATGTQFAVVTVPSLRRCKPSSPKAFATALFNHWGVGPRNKNNGVLVLLVMDARRIQARAASLIPVTRDPAARPSVDSLARSLEERSRVDARASERCVVAFALDAALGDGGDTPLDGRSHAHVSWCI